MASSVNISNVSKVYESTHVIHGIDIDIGSGEFVVLVGPSGCGKSTLLRMIAGLEDISGGEISIDGKVVNGLLPKDRDIAMVFQNYALYPHMTVKENMAFSMKVRHADKDQVENRVSASAAILGLQEHLERYPRQLSGGQRQRVAMGRAIVRDPRLFLFDEPLSNLDAKLRVQMRMEIKALHQRLGTTFIYVTHDQIEAMTMADRIVVMRSGVIEQIGTPKELYETPANHFVAGFIGSPTMNFIKGELRFADGAWTFVSTGGQALPLPAGVDIAHAGAAVYGIRPEHLRIDTDGLCASVRAVELTGADTFVHCDVGGDQLCMALRDGRDFQPGDSISVSPAIESVHLFDAQTGISLIDRSGRRAPSYGYGAAPAVAAMPEPVAHAASR